MKHLLKYLLVLSAILISCKNKQDPKVNGETNTTVETKVPEKPKLVIDATKDAEYVVNTYANGLYAIKAAELIKQKSNNKTIKEVANKVASTQSKIIEELNQLASEKKISLPSNLNQVQISELNSLTEKEPQVLEKVFMRQIENEHKENIETLEKISRESEDNELTTLAIAYLPELKSQYEEVVAVRERLEL